MKNDLTTDEWLIMAKFLNDILWEPSEEEEKILDRAIEKFTKVADQIRNR